MTIADLNGLNRQDFVHAIGWVFEHSPWVAERAWLWRPFASLDELHAAMVEAVEEGTADEQLALLRAHPDLGLRVRESQASTLTEASAAEQAGAGLDSLSPGEFARLQELNAAYRATFGFPFLYAVKGGTKHDILKALEARASGSAGGREQEFREALRQVSRIARFRLEDTLS